MCSPWKIKYYKLLQMFNHINKQFNHINKQFNHQTKENKKKEAIRLEVYPVRKVTHLKFRSTVV